MCACAPEIARGYKIPLEHLRWYAAFHRKEDSVHIHMVVFSSDPKEGYLTRQGIQQVKSAFGRRIFQQDLLHVYEQKTEYRDALGRDAERTMAELITQMETGQIQNENLERLVLELAQRLHNTQGKKVYGYLPPKTKVLVDAIVDELAKDERVAAAYNLWNQMREEVCRTYSEQLPERLPLSKQKEFKAVRNMVIRETLRLGRCEPPTTDEVVHGFTPSTHRLHNPVCRMGYITHSRRSRTTSVHRHIGRIPRGYRPMCPSAIPQHGPHLPRAVRLRCHPGLPAHRQEAPPDAPEKRMAWDTRPMTMRKSPSILKDKMGDCH